MDKPQDWYFTFGVGHFYSGRFVKIHDNWYEARQEMFRRFGKQWAGQYDEEEFAKIKQQYPKYQREDAELN